MENLLKQKTKKDVKRYEHGDAEDIFKHAEAWWITNFLCDDYGYHAHWKKPLPPGGSVPNKHYAAKFLSNSAVSQAFATELYLKCLQVIEKGSFREGHSLLELYYDLSDETRKKLVEYHDIILKNNSNHKKYVKYSKLKPSDFTIEKSLERSARAFQDFRYMFAIKKNKYELYVTHVVHACKQLIAELRPGWESLMNPMPINRKE